MSAIMRVTGCTRGLLVGVAVTAFSTAWPAAAQEVPATPKPVTDRAPSLEQLARGGQVALSLDDAIAIALAQNLDVEVQRLGPRLADADLARARAGGVPKGVPLSVREGPRSVSGTTDLLFPSVGFGADTNIGLAAFTSGGGRLPPAQDAVLHATLGRADSTQPQPNSFSAGTSELSATATTASVGLVKGFLTGGELSVSFDNVRTDTNNRRYDLNPFTASSLAVTFVQPLARGFGPAVNGRFIRIARNDRAVSDLVFEQQVVTTVASVVRLYWDLASLTEEVAVRRQALARADRLLADTEAHAEAGTRAPIDVVRARAEAARARRDLIVAEGVARQQEAVLKDYLSGGTVADPALASVRLVASDPLDVSSDPLPDAETLAETAARTRPDLAQARLQVENTRIALDASRNARLPAVDAVLTLRGNGLAGELNPLTLPGAAPHTADPALLGGYGTLLDQIAGRRFPDYVVGLQVSVPIGNRAASADAARDAIALRQQEIRLQQIEKQVRLEIANALVALEQARATVEAARQERELQEQALAAEIDRLDVGASTTYLVIQYQRDLAQARSAEVSAEAGWLKARAALARAGGTLLASYGLSVTESEIRKR